MNFQINTHIVSKPKDEFLKYSDQRISGLKLTLDDDQVNLYQEAKEKGLEYLDAQEETV